MQPFIILHSNDIHGRIEGLTRIATLVEQIKNENPQTPVLYFDAGDVEEHTKQLSNFTKGAAMYRLLAASGCNASTLGNGGIMRYGNGVLPRYAQAARYPLLLANLSLLDGSPLPAVQPSVLLQVGSLRLGVIGVTSPVDGFYDTYGLFASSPALPVIQNAVAQLRQEGADAIILLSHLGLDVDREIASSLQGDISLIIGAHSHSLLLHGEHVGRILIAQAGQFAEHLGRLDLLWDGTQLQVQHVAVLPITDAITPSARVVNEVNVIDGEINQFLGEVIGELAEPLDFASDRECGTANLMADMLRERLQAEVGMVTAGIAFTGPLPAGPLQRVGLWAMCPSTDNPAIITLTGAQLLAVVKRGLNPDLAQDRPRPLRGHARGLLHLSGATMRDGTLFVGEQPVEPERTYRVAGADWDLTPGDVYVLAKWHVMPTYDLSIILREALEEYLAQHSPVHVEMGRLG